MKLSKHVATIGAMASFAFGSAAFAGACSTSSCTATIQKFYVNASGVVYIQLNTTSSDTSTLDCTLVSGVYFTIDPNSASNFQAIYATLLAAGHTARAVTLRVVDGSPNCAIQYITESL